MAEVRVPKGRPEELWPLFAGLEVLDALAARMGDFRLDVVRLDWGSDRYKATGAFMPADGLAQLKTMDAIYFGAVGAQDVPDHVSLWGLRLPICQGFDQYANVRPPASSPASPRPCAMSAPATSTG
jgi:tartrate dehydrogenase/decarboxylase/D-malate dehydrogenase